MKDNNIREIQENQIQIEAYKINKINKNDKIRL